MIAICFKTIFTIFTLQGLDTGGMSRLTYVSKIFSFFFTIFTLGDGCFLEAFFLSSLWGMGGASGMEGVSLKPFSYLHSRGWGVLRGWRVFP